MNKALEKLIVNIAELFKVKTIVTLAMTYVMVQLVLKKIEVTQEVLVIFSTSYGSVLTYFFTKPKEVEVKEAGKMGE